MADGMQICGSRQRWLILVSLGLHVRADRMLIILLASIVASCCREKVEQTERSPSGDKVAVVVDQNCGVLSDGTSVRLRDARSTRDDLVVSGSRGRGFTVLWKDNDTLQVFMITESGAARSTLFGSEIHHKSEDVNGTRIDYR